MRKLTVLSDEGTTPPELIKNFSEYVGISFPSSYIVLIGEHDYLYPKERMFKFINSFNEYEERDISFLGYKKSLNYEDIYNYSCIDDEYGYERKVISFGISANGDYICFDYRENNKNPSIILMHHDEFYENDSGNTKMLTNHIANSFDDFLEMLYEPLD